MKKPVFTIFILLVISGIMLFSNCRKKEDMTVIIYVKMMDDTSIVVPNARVNLVKGDIDVVGYTNQIGKYQYTFKNPVILDVLAEKDTTISGVTVTMEGRTVLRLGDPGETYTKSVFIH